MERRKKRYRVGGGRTLRNPEGGDLSLYLGDDSSIVLVSIFSLEKMFSPRPFKDRRPFEFDRELGSRLVSRRFEDVWNESKLPLFVGGVSRKKGEKNQTLLRCYCPACKSEGNGGGGDVNSLG